MPTESIDKSFIKKATNNDWVENLRARWIIALVAICCILLIGVPVIVLCIKYSYQNFLIQQLIAEELRSQPKSVSIKNVTVFQEDNQIYKNSDKPYIVISGFTARDYRANAPYSLQISGVIINEGGGIAYNGVLHVVAMSNESIVIDTNHSFGGITPHVPLQLDFSLKYNGSPITNCTITPIYTDTAK